MSAPTPDAYSAAGVDYAQIDPLKVAAQQAARRTAAHLKSHGFAELEASRGESAYLVDIGGVLVASITECLGTKVLVAEAMRPITGRTYFDALAQDTLAMAVNDIITVGATPVSVHAYWAAGDGAWFADRQRAEDLVRGWERACDICQVSWGGGETPSLAGVVMQGAIDLAASCVGVVRPRERLSLGDKLAPGNAIVLLASSGIHANGISLARKTAAETGDGYRAGLSDGRMFGDALLDATTLYAPVTEALFAAGIVPTYCANITGHGWRKVMRHRAGLTYRFHAVPPVPPVLAYLAHAAGLDPAEAYGTFNMGAGFAIFVDQAQAAATVEIAKRAGVAAWNAGTVEDGPKRVVIEPLGVAFSGEELKLRA